MEGLGICVFARMPGVFEPCTRLDHLGWLRYLASQTPLSRSIGSLAKLLGDGPFWILVTSGSLNSNSTSARTSLVPKPLPSCDAFASIWSIPRVLLDRFLLPTIRPRFQEQRTTGHTQSALHSALQCME